MSESKLVMARKLHNVQRRLMNADIEDIEDLDVLIPLIFKECADEGLCFWFSFLEDNTVILNLRDVSHDNWELNIRYYCANKELSCDSLKLIVLSNVFLLTKDASSADTGDVNTKDTENNEFIVSGDTPVPQAIRDAIDTIKAKGIPVTPEAINNHLPTGKMSTGQIMECNKYLKKMKEGSL